MRRRQCAGPWRDLRGRLCEEFALGRVLPLTALRTAAPLHQPPRGAVSSSSDRLHRIAIAMSRPDLRRLRRARDAAAANAAGDPLELQTLLQHTYRQLEHAYHCSPEYERMVELYPVLAQAIANCRQTDLVGHAAPADQPKPRLTSCRGRSGGSRRKPPSQ